MSYEGWTNQQTWNVHVMMGNDRKPNDLMHKIVRGALDGTLYKTPGAARVHSDEAIYQAVAKLFAKYFRPIRDNAKKEFDENLRDTIAERGEFEARQIEGKNPPPSEHGPQGDILNQAMDLIRGDMGSGPLPEWEEPNWLEIAKWEVEEEKLQRSSAEAAKRKKVHPGEDVELPDDMKEGLREMGIKGSKADRVWETMFKGGPADTGKRPRGKMEPFELWDPRADKWYEDLSYLDKPRTEGSRWNPRIPASMKEVGNWADSTYEEFLTLLEEGQKEAAAKEARKLLLPHIRTLLPPEKIKILEGATMEFKQAGMQCDCEGMPCEEAGQHRAGLCPNPPAVWARAFGMKEKLCKECADRLRQDVPEAKILGTIGGTMAANRSAAGDDPNWKPIWEQGSKGYEVGWHYLYSKSQGGTLEVRAESAGEAKRKADNLLRINEQGTAIVIDNVRPVLPGVGEADNIVKPIGGTMAAKGNTVRFTLKGKKRSSTFSSPEVAREFIKAAAEKWGNNFDPEPITSGINGIEGPQPESLQTAGVGNQVVDPCLCGCSRDGHDEKGYCDKCLDCHGYTPKDLYIDKPDPSKYAGFNFFYPGQALKEFYPEIQHEIVDYPNATNAPMTEAGVDAPKGTNDQMVGGIVGDPHEDPALDMAVEASFEGMTRLGYVSTSPSAGAGLGRDFKPQVLEGSPFRKENEIRGGMFDEEFHAQYDDGPALGVVAKQAGLGQEKGQFGSFLKKVMAEVAATFVAAYKVTSRSPLDKIPGTGELALDQVDQQQPGMSSFILTDSGSRVKHLVEKLNDNDIQDCINDAWAQAAVWCSDPAGGFVYEVFVRAETLDSESLKLKYRFVTGTRDAHA